MSAKRGHGAIVELLLSHGADAEVTGLAYGTTALIAAAQQGHLSIVHKLLTHGADPRRPLHDGTTALDKAHQYGHADVAGVLGTALAWALDPPGAPGLCISPRHSAAVAAAAAAVARLEVTDPVPLNM